MSQRVSPDRPRETLQLVDPKSGQMTTEALQMIDQLWRQTAAGFHVTPCKAVTTVGDAPDLLNVIALQPRMHEEGAADLATGMAFFFKADATSTGPVSIKLYTAKRQALSEFKAYLEDGATQVDSGDIVLGTRYWAIFDQELNSDAGGWIIK